MLAESVDALHTVSGDSDLVDALLEVSEDRGEIEPVDSTVGTLKDKGHLALLFPEPLEPFESCT